MPGAAADTAEMQAKVQALRGSASWKYRNAGLSYTAARAMVTMQQQSEEAWFRREAEAEAAVTLPAGNSFSGVQRAPLEYGQLLNQAKRVVVVAHSAELRLTEAR